MNNELIVAPQTLAILAQLQHLFERPIQPLSVQRVERAVRQEQRVIYRPNERIEERIETRIEIIHFNR